MSRKVIIVLIYRNDETSVGKLKFGSAQVPFYSRTVATEAILNAQSVIGTQFQLYLEASHSTQMTDSSMKLLSQPRQFTV
jgi:hypothetical protein